MKQVINILLKPKKKIERIRKILGVNIKKFKPHITIVYPFDLENQNNLSNHIKSSIQDVKKFKLTLNGLKKSAKGNHLYLLVDKGKKELIDMHKKLHRKILKDFRNKNIPKYIPHLSLGNFKSRKEIDKAIQEIKKQNLYFEMQIKSLQLITLKRNYSIKKIKNFNLK